MKKSQFTSNAAGLPEGHVLRMLWRAVVALALVHAALRNDPGLMRTLDPRTLNTMMSGCDAVGCLRRAWQRRMRRGRQHAACARARSTRARIACPPCRMLTTSGRCSHKMVPDGKDDPEIVIWGLFDENTNFTRCVAASRHTVLPAPWQTCAMRSTCAARDCARPSWMACAAAHQ